MRKSEKYKLLYVGLVIMLCLVLSGCAGEVSEPKEETGWVRFAIEDEKLTRSITQTSKMLYPVEDVYWTYTAEKTSGLYTDGESKKIDSEHANPGSGDDVYVERPVKAGPGTGLDSEVGPFATGEWVFKIYGYIGCKVEAGVLMYDTLVYKGSLNYKVIEVGKKQTADAPTVLFEIEPTGLAPEFGKLVFGDMKLTIPENDGLFSKNTSSDTTLKDSAGNRYPEVETEVKVRIWDVSGTAAGTTVDPTDDNLIATSITNVGTDVAAGETLSLCAFVPVEGKSEFSTSDANEGRRTFVIAAEYQDRYTKYASENVEKPEGSTIYDAYLYKYSAGSEESKYYENGYAAIGDMKICIVQFHTGYVTRLSGDINDIGAAKEGGSGQPFRPAVAKMLKPGKTASTATDSDYYYFLNIKDAVEEYTESDRPIVLIGNVADGGSVSLDEDVLVDNSGKYTVNNIKLSGSHDMEFSVGGGSYKFKDGIVSCLKFQGDYVEMDTYRCSVDISASTNIVHRGSVTGLVVESAKTYELMANVNGELSLNNAVSDAGNVVRVCDGVRVDSILCEKGHLELGEFTEVGVLNVSATSSGSSVKGTLTTEVGNILSIRDGGTDCCGVFKKLTLHGNNVPAGGGSETVRDIYGINGMYISLPTFESAGGLLFSNGSLGFVDWNTSAAGNGVGYNDCDKVNSGAVTNLYARWSQPVGGRIFYVSEVSNGGNYVFFDSAGKRIKLDEGVSYNAENLSGAVSYGVMGKAANSKDMFYVYDTTNGAVGLGVAKGHTGIAWGCNGMMNLKGSPYNVKNSDGIGAGKSNTEYVLATKGVSSGAFSKLITSLVTGTSSSYNLSGNFDMCGLKTNDVLTLSSTGGASAFKKFPRGTYKLECWGAKGGYGGSYPSLPAYVSGVWTNTVDMRNVYVKAGGAGERASASNVVARGGFNGGGDGWSDARQMASGGGASDIRLDADELENRVLVAGGGGGTGDSSSSQLSAATDTFSAGGYLNGYAGKGGNDRIGQGGTALSGGLGATRTYGTCPGGSFGLGGSSLCRLDSHSGNSHEYHNGGGGGWYGGGSSSADGGGGGGSSMIWISGNTRYYPVNTTLLADDFLASTSTGSANTANSSTVKITVQSVDGDFRAGNNTIWAYIDFLRNGTSYSTICWDATTRSGCETLDSRKAAAVKQPGGWNDWYIPSKTELEKLGLWCGAMYDVGGSVVRLDADCAPFGDIDKAEVWSWFKNRNLWSSIENDAETGVCIMKNGTDLDYTEKCLDTGSVVAVRSF